MHLKEILSRMTVQRISRHTEQNTIHTTG